MTQMVLFYEIVLENGDIEYVYWTKRAVRDTVENL